MVVRIKILECSQCYVYTRKSCVVCEYVFKVVTGYSWLVCNNVMIYVMTDVQPMYSNFDEQNI